MSLPRHPRCDGSAISRSLWVSPPDFSLSDTQKILMAKR